MGRKRIEREITNTGAYDDVFDLSVIGIESAWYSLSASSVTLDQDESTNMTLVISVSEDLEVMENITRSHSTRR